MSILTDWDIDCMDPVKALIPVDIDVSVDKSVMVSSELISFWIAFRLLYIGVKSTATPPFRW